MNHIIGFAVQSHEETLHTGAEKNARPDDLPGSARTADDDYADILVRMWSLATGRIPRFDVRPSQFTEQELLWFWDDLTPAVGRHAITARSSRSGAAG
jgi:hypothetical protein